MRFAKYPTLFSLSWQKQLEVRSDFFFERTRSIAVLISLYYLWSALLANRTDVGGYARGQILTYVLAMTLLRAWVLACVTDRIPSEIARGKISELLLRPISHVGYWATQDAANKALNMMSAIVEVGIFALIVRPPIVLPPSPLAWLAFALATLGGMALYFEMSYLLGVMGFWTAQSWGPRFCFEIVLEFCAGAYFPVDLLPPAAQKIIGVLPFPYLIFHPLSIFLGRTPPSGYASVFAHQIVWITALGVLGRALWRAGLRRYAAEGG
ncbi:MAG: ABC-2 family transporter protein [Elusimicrobia bacterium]|nr:ABC-2 family transporter protein [Elusimicrobiota bacterium]